MKLKPYSEYKDSGIGWSKEMPQNWSVSMLRWLSKLYSGGTPDKKNIDFWANGTIPWINSGSVNQILIEEPSTCITIEAFHNSSAKWIYSDSLVMALAGQGKTKGMVAQLKIDTTCNQSMAAIVPGLEISSRYLFWWLTKNYQNIRNMAGGDLRDGLNLVLLGNIPCLLPSAEEQSAIASFLDHETSKIDNLIAEQENLISLLEEKRKAIISHVVIKGLNPNTPTKESGVEWLGEVPDHWKVKTIGQTSYLKGRVGWKGLTSQEYLEEGYAYLVTGSDFKEKFVNWKECYQINKERYEDDPYIQLKSGDLLITKDGTIGKLVLVDETDKPACLNSGIFLIRPQNLYITSFLYWVLKSSVFSFFHDFKSQGSTIKHLYQNVFDKFAFPIPPIEEQEVISAYLEKENINIDNIIHFSLRSIELLKERRSALISSAVTGKIDVRDFKPLD